MMSLEVEIAEADATKIRRQAVELVSQVASAEVFSFSIAKVDGRPHYTSCVLSAEFRALSVFEGTPMLGGSIAQETDQREWTAADPSPTALNRFGTLAEEYEDRRSVQATAAHRLVYEPFEITDQARALMYDGSEFLGFIAATRQGGEEFDAETVSRLRDHTPEIHRLLVLARKFEAERNTGALHLIANEHGQILYADERSRGWLTARRLAFIRRMLQEKRPRVIDHMAPRIGWLDNGHRKIRHIALSPVPPLCASKWHHLSPTQREIVGLALEGLTNREIARLRGLGESTVKYHLNEAARTLDVSGRNGLRQALSARPS